MRGVPGSGKSYLAHQIKGDGMVFSADDYFVNYQGQYLFDRNQLGDAHEWNQKRANEALKSGTNPVVIDNTNLEAWEMRPYIFMALR
jgi:predicted kinase